MSRTTDWVLFKKGDDGVETWHQYETTPDGVTKLNVREFWDPAWQQALLDRAAAERAANAGKRWGDGQVIGRLPLTLYFNSGMAKARVQGDTTWIKRFWNDSEHSKLRTFEGKL